MEENKQEGLIVNDFGEMMKESKSNKKIFTTLTDEKKLFNLETSCDMKINDCKGEKIRVVDMVIKIYENTLKEPEINEETGEIKDKEVKMITILIDDNGVSYVTASKMFTIQMMNYIKMFGIDGIKEGLDIKITERAIKDSSNKALAFELI